MARVWRIFPPDVAPFSAAVATSEIGIARLLCGSQTAPTLAAIGLHSRETRDSQQRAFTIALWLVNGAYFGGNQHSD